VGARVVVATNPRSGAGRGRSVGAAALAGLAAEGVAAEDVTAGSAAATVQALADAVRAGVDAVVVCGGDGMVNLAVNAVADTPVALGIVPAGTGNDIARVLGLPSRPDDAVRAVAAALAGGGRRRVDAVRCTGAHGSRWFAGVLAAGFDALVNERANGWSDRWGHPRGRARYVLAVARELPVLRERPYVIDLDGRRVETNAMIVAVANGHAYGGGMRISPGADPADGLLDVVVAGPISRVEFVRVFPKVFSGRHVGHRHVSVHRARRVSVDAPGIVGYADGERFGPLPLACEAVPGALTLLTP
jgi:diacylglycerol kinase (ATP)